ncbi:hypothetical protein [Pseudomonas gorinensis]
MKAYLRIFIACFACLVFSTAHAAGETPKNAFKRTYDQMLAELPNVRSELSEQNVGSGMKLWVGVVPIGTADAVVQIKGIGKDQITELTVLFIFSTETQDRDYENAFYLRDVLFQALIGSKDSFDYVNAFFIGETRRQRPIIRAGGTPERGVKNIGYGTAQLTVEITPTPRGLIATYSMRAL